MQTRIAYHVVPQISAHARYAAAMVRCTGVAVSHLASVSHSGMVRQMRTILFALALTAAAGAGCAKSKSDKPTSEDRDRRKAAAPKRRRADAGSTVDKRSPRASAQAVDANGDRRARRWASSPARCCSRTRETFKLSELPADKTKALVFYCANTTCGALAQAAERALDRRLHQRQGHAARASPVGSKPARRSRRSSSTAI